MRILVVGAGATGGYFGGRLLQHGRDVTFLVREKRAAALSKHGLVIHSPAGDASMPAPPTVLATELDAPFDLIILSCKAYGLQQAMDDIAPAVGPDTAILPLLNGMQQLDLLGTRFGARHVLGGQCVIAATLDEQGAVRHLNQTHTLTYGERDGSSSARMQRITDSLGDAGFDARPSANILQDMWDKWVFLASLAGINCLMRGPVGAIVATPSGKEAIRALFDECRAVADRAGHPLSEATQARARGVLTEAGSTLTASMLRDLLHGHPIEADHVIGDMLARAERTHDAISLLRVVYTHLKVYESSRADAQTA
ncbi:MAG: 2-dehydropantoate 2-reductase [Pseudomonadota bacterium]|nr:2-dehydropantoate 2-reductase [Pseudomonadota bacterium]